MSSSNDRNPRRPGAGRGGPRGGLGSTLIGVFIGVALGLSIAVAVAFYLMRAGNPYQPAVTATRDATRDVPATRASKSDPSTTKPRFDFYKILPGAEEPKVSSKPAERTPDQATIDRTRHPAAEPQQASAPAPAATAPSGQARAADRFWLQAGSFSTEGDAENLRARLALAGLEAAVQQADVPDKGVRYRVRLGPYDNTDELNHMKAELGRRGFEVAVIKG